MIKHIDWNGRNLCILDQKLLPLKSRWIHARSMKDIFLIIREMNVRGAPLIGIVAAFGVVLHIKSKKIKDIKELEDKINEAVELLSKSRPTAVNLSWALERMRDVSKSLKNKKVNEIVSALEKEAVKIWHQDIEISKKMSLYGADLIRDGDKVLTHCNAGGLATGGYGTALGVFLKAKEQGKKNLIYVDETRPVLQGGRLTCWELKEAGIEYTLICDNMAGYFMRRGEINKVFVGADRIVKNGGFANKIGTYSIAQLAKIHNIPFYVVAPSSSFDLTLNTQDEIPIEERDIKEVLYINGKAIAPTSSRVANPAFDITPPELISAIITEAGVIREPFDKSIAQIFNIKGMDSKRTIAHK